MPWAGQLDFVIVSDPRPKSLLPRLNFSPKPEPKIDRDGPVFDVGPISKMADIDRQALVGMLPKRRDPAMGLQIQTFIAQNGMAKWPTGFAKGYVGQLNGWAYYYSRKLEPGTSGYRAAQELRREAYADGQVGISVVGGQMVLDDKLHDRHCANPECLKKLADDRRLDAKYCDDTCSKDDRRRKDDLKIRDAGRPLSGLIPGGNSPVSKQNQSVSCCPLAKTESPNTYEATYSFRDDVIGQLFADGRITQDQFDAARSYEADADDVGGRLRAAHRDENDISVWRPREPDSKPKSATEIRRSKYPIARIKAANNALGREATALLHATLSSNTTTDVEMLCAALDVLIDSYSDSNEPLKKETTKWITQPAR
jgi:hypothetical protein